MNDMEANLRQILDVRRGSVELSSTEAPQKLNSCLLKLRQLVKKNSVHTISNQTLQQTADLHMSKQTMEGTLWETCSPTASYLNDSAHLVAKKPRNTTTNKLNMTVNPKAGSQNSFAFYQPNIEDMKGRTPSTRPSSTKVANLMSSMSSPKATYLDLNVTDLNGSRSTKNAAFNPHKFINFLLSQPKTSTNQVKKASKLNSCVQGEEENDDNKNISGETRTKSFATSTYQLKKSVDAKNTSQPESQINQENKVPVIQEYNLEKLRVSKSKVKIGLPLSDLKKNERSLTLTKKSSSGNLRKKKGLTVENDSMNEVEKNRRDTTADKSRSKKRLAVTPDTLSHRERDAEGEIQIDNKALRLTPKLFKACNDLLASRKDSAQKDARLKSRKRSSTRSKGQRLKSASKRNLKQESPVKNTVERAGNGRRQNAPGSLMLRAVKGSTPNILSSSISRIGGLSTKYMKKGESHTYLSNITGEFEKSNEMTMSHAHDTTANTKMGSRKDLTIDENNRDSVLLKRLLRAKSQGGKAIEEALAEMANRDKEAQQLGARSNGRVLSLKQSMKDKRTLAAFKSVDEKSSIFKDSDVNKSACNKTLNLEQKFESVMDHNSQEKSKECEQMGLLRKVLERTKQMLGDYKEKERVWQSEKQDLLKQIINLQKSK